MNPVEFVRNEHAALTALRRDLHAHPELGFEEHRTAEVVARELDALGVEHHGGIGKTGIVAVIRGAKGESGRAMGLGADMDDLPMHEENEFAHVSRFRGGCTAAATTGTRRCCSARRVSVPRAQLDGTVYLIFQPGEEGSPAARR
jgi:hippurate hydrolase